MCKSLIRILKRERKRERERERETERRREGGREREKKNCWLSLLGVELQLGNFVD